MSYVQHRETRRWRRRVSAVHRFRAQNHAAETKATPDTTQAVLPIDQRIVGDSAVSVSAQGTSVPPWPRDVATRGDALTLLRSLPDDCAAAAFFDPQHRGVLDRLKYGNEGARQRARCALPAMSDGYIDACCRDIARVLRPSGYLMLWADTFRLCTGAHLRIADILPCVDLISWDCGRIGHGLPHPAARRLSAGAAEATAAREGDLA